MEENQIKTGMIGDAVLSQLLSISSEDGAIDLRKIPNSKADNAIQEMLIEGEKLIGVYQTIRDQLIFTNKRVISVDVKDATGKRRQYLSLPYSKVQYFSVQTAGFLELIPDTELVLVFSNGMCATFEFKGKNDIMEIARFISEFALVDCQSKCK